MAGRVHGVGQRARRPGRRLLDLRLLPPGRGAADPPVARRPAALDGTVRPPVEGLLVVDDCRSHVRRAGGRHLEWSLPGLDYPKPRFMWVNFTLTDSAFHEGGPHSEIAAAAIRDCDA